MVLLSLFRCESHADSILTHGVNVLLSLLFALLITIFRFVILTVTDFYMCK